VRTLVQDWSMDHVCSQNVLLIASGGDGPWRASGSKTQGTERLAFGGTLLYSGWRTGGRVVDGTALEIRADHLQAVSARYFQPGFPRFLPGAHTIQDIQFSAVSSRLGPRLGPNRRLLSLRHVALRLFDNRRRKVTHRG
jgi:hypothetical protein